MYAQSLSQVQLFANPWTVAQQAPLPWDFPGKGTGWVAIFFSRGLPDPESKPMSLASPALTGGLFTNYTTWESFIYHYL